MLPQRHRELRDQIDAGRRGLCRRGPCRRGIEQAKIARAGTAADLVIAAHDDPRRRAQCRRGGREEVRLPGWPIVAVGATRAAGVAGRAGALAIEVVADVDDQVGLGVRDALGHLCEWPERGIVAILEFASSVIVVGVALLRRRLCGLEAAAGVAESGDRLQGGPGNGEGRILKAGRTGARRNRSLADENRESGVGHGANAHYLLCPVDADRRAFARLREHRACHRTLRTEHDIGRFEPGRLCVGGPWRAEGGKCQRRSREPAPQSGRSRRDNHATCLLFRLDGGSEGGTRGDRCTAASAAYHGARRGAHQRKTAAPQGGGRPYAGA